MENNADLNHLQKVLLMILSDVDELLTKNKIPYFLDGGSALGAVRHHGFIPWDDDLDIVIMPDVYPKFVEICRTQLNKAKYTFEEAHKDWPLCFSKIKLNGTFIDEVDAYPSANRGIYIDIFTLDYARKSKVGKYFQYLLGRMFTAGMLASKPYSTSCISKKALISIMRYLYKIPSLKKWFFYQVRGQKESDTLSAVWDRTRANWKKYFCRRDLFESSILIDFEGRKFPVCKGFDEYLSNLYGDYMKLPPENERVGLHINKIDFGSY